MAQDSLALLRHDMKPIDPYPYFPKDTLPSDQQDIFHPRAPTTTITQLPQQKYVYQPSIIAARPLASDRNHIRSENTRGTLGATVNFDGSKRETRTISIDKTGANDSSGNNANASTLSSLSGEPTDLIYFGAGETCGRRRDNFKHGPGIETVIYTDSRANIEKRKAVQQEMAKYEKIQFEERERKRQDERQQRIKDQQNVKWPFGSKINVGPGADQLQFHHVIPFRAEEVALRQYEKLRAEEYAHELDAQIAADKCFKIQLKQEAPKHDDDTKWMFHHSQMPGRRSKVPLEPPNDKNTDPISHTAVSYKAPATFETRKARSKLIDERKDPEPTSLQLGNDHSRRKLAALNATEILQPYHEPEFGRKKFVFTKPSTDDQEIAEIESKKIRKFQELELRQRQEFKETKKRQEKTLGKQYAESYPWKWGNSDNEDRVKENPHHKSTDVVQTVEPIDRNKAKRYQAELDQLVRQKHAQAILQKQIESDLWKRHVEYSFENALGRANQGGRRRNV
ncbi:hypothetical protein HK100_008800 [Physocladia obscura]|uniref:Uncharacterized protein n=1 Tax=Physocladia obscura TaxID=109957 RepID=A0AAD5SMH8_9FUNG|nr:hypothetical protein HK100_008800 [Physocladia obscura]